jgi:hypothetical protein
LLRSRSTQFVWMMFEPDRSGIRRGLFAHRENKVSLLTLRSNWERWSPDLAVGWHCFCSACGK